MRCKWLFRSRRHTKELGEACAMLAKAIKSLRSFPISWGRSARRQGINPLSLLRVRAEGELLAENVDTWPQTVHKRGVLITRRAGAAIFTRERKSFAKLTRTFHPGAAWQTARKNPLNTTLRCNRNKPIQNNTVCV